MNVVKQPFWQQQRVELYLIDILSFSTNQSFHNCLVRYITTSIRLANLNLVQTPDKQPFASK